MMADVQGSSATVKSAMRTLDILELVVAHDHPLATNEIADALCIPVSSLSYLLATLVERGYLERQGRRYGAGAGLKLLQPRKSEPSLADRVAPLVRMLRAQLNETATFFVRNGSMAEALVTEVGDHALRYSLEVGRQAPLHALASGKALLATFTPQELDAYFADTRLEPLTPDTITSEKELRKQIEEARRTGFAHAREEFALGIASVGRAIAIDGNVVGALSVAIPLPRWSDQMEQRAMALLKRAGNLVDGEQRTH
jgi:IclR family acetate operon transcriptional repressor